MNSIKWIGDETVDDLYDKWIELVEAGNRAQLVRELSYAVNRGTHSPESHESDSDEMMIRELAYGDDADKIIEMVRESDGHTVGENLR
jgi:hypothetical protein